MHLFRLAYLCLLAASPLVSSAPTQLKQRDAPHHAPLPDGLPDPTQGQIESIQHRAQGTLPNTPPPARISSEGITNLKLIAFAELFEVAFFDELLRNITTNVHGFQISNPLERETVIRALDAILAQEELHAISANNGLRHFNLKPIRPCRYRFPVSDFKSAIELAGAFTDLVLGTLQDIVERFARGDDFGLARNIASVIGQEGEQLGWYRILQNKIPSQLPFLTTSDIDFAFTLVQQFTVPKSCPDIDEIPLQTFRQLNILTPPGPQTQIIKVSWKPVAAGRPEQLWMTYINQQNLPTVKPMNIVASNPDTVTAEALFPYNKNLMNGLTIAAVTNSSGPFATADDVSKATVFGPGVIIVN